METIQVILDKKLLQATDRAARQTRQNRSALVREALRNHLRQLKLRVQENNDWQGYLRKPQDDSEAWEAEAKWPE